MAVLELDRIVLGGTARTRDDAIREAGAALVAAGAVEPAYVDAMFDRENTVSTYMGNYLAIPHGTNDAKDSIKSSALSIIRYDEPIDWDGNEVRFVVGIAGLNNEHLEILSKLAIVFSEEDEVQKLLDAGSAQEVYTLLGDVNED
ncbi:PTS sugar transporter subunit IIA [Amnibacterium flavum]|uniref:Mannitol-specific phosphotransferase enzyme IIA component n=1 Tax=Amnibacterium flavum TaxID=2173173 RepID=A0A2V1HWY3_9MICO|nr:PTS sugar transporter subunit IIA [Amnibacterium flavum]PVZ95077.1 PTS mannitol transporter subunit IIA [Amnibacterium flavum]